MTETNGVDLDCVVHGLNLGLSSMRSQLAEKDRSDHMQIRTMLETIGKFVGAQLKPLKDEIAGLKAQVEELKKRGVSYKGIYQKACAYEVGDLVSFDRSVWCAVRVAQAGESPGASPSQWQMALRGDGREPRLPTQGGARPATTISRRT